MGYRLKLVWKFAEPFLFPVIGASVSLTEIPISTMVSSILCVIASISVKMMASFYSAWFAGLSQEEQLFTCGIWTGKGSVQVTILLEK